MSVIFEQKLLSKIKVIPDYNKITLIINYYVYNYYIGT